MPSNANATVVGGLFALESPADRPMPPELLADKPMMLVSGRAALAVALARLERRRVWVPAFVCEAVLDGVGHGSEVRFYGVGDLQTIPRLDDAGPEDAVIVVDYFGWPSPAGLIRALRDAGAAVIEDASQAMLSAGVGTEADHWIASPRKFLGVPDGGLLGPPPRNAPLTTAAPSDWWLQALDACVQRRAFDDGASGRGWFATFREAEASVPVAPHAMSELSRQILTHAIDAGSIATRRRRNYERLFAELADLALMGPLPDGVVPLGFPICVKDRDRVRETLFQDDVYAPIHWPVPDAVPPSFAAERRLAAGVMTIPCDQRYGDADMARVARLVRAAS